MKNLIIIGVGGFAREIYWYAQTCNEFNTEWKIKGFLDGDIKLDAAEYEKLPPNVPVLGDVNNYEICEDDVFTCAIGAPQVRKKLIEKMLERGADFVNIIGKGIIILPTMKFGRGVIVGFQSTLSDHSEIGDFVVINTASHLGHDVKVGNHTCIMSNVDIAGGTQIGENVFIGSHVSIIPKVKVEYGAKIGMGSVVLKRVRANTTVVGNPAIEF